MGSRAASAAVETESTRHLRLAPRTPSARADDVLEDVPATTRQRTFVLVRAVLIVAVSSLAILNARAALPSSQVFLVVAALVVNAVLSQLDAALFFTWWVQAPLLLIDTAGITVLLIGAGLGQQVLLFYFIELFLVAISESLGLLAIGAVLIGTASVALGMEDGLSAASLIRLPFFFATAIFYGYVLDAAKLRRRLVVERHRWTEELEREVSIRTHELEQQSMELRTLYEEVREADRLKSEFVANVSHELRTPIHVIAGYADLALEDPQLPADAEVRTFVERIVARARSLHRLVESLLYYGSLERRQATASPMRFTADELLRELRSLCTDAAVPAAVKVRIDSAPAIQMTSDFDRLYSVLSSVLLNAMKFTAAGEVVVSVHEVGEEIELRVRDTGIGIPPAAIPHIFEPFRQVDGSTTRAFGGVGLGLAIASRNMKLLGGRIEVESDVTRGSTFRVFVPRHPVEPTAASPPEPEPATSVPLHGAVMALDSGPVPSLAAVSR